MRDAVYQELAKRCGGLVARMENLTISHYASWMQELKRAAPDAGFGGRTSPSVAPFQWEASTSLSDVDFDALLSIYLQCYKHHIRKNAHRHKDSGAVARYVQRLRAGESILSIARSVQFPPYMLMRYIVKHGDIWRGRNGQDGAERGAPSQRRKREGNGRILGQAGHNVDELCIRAALQLAAEADAYFSPTVDTVRLNVGFEYEILLQHRLASLGVAFQNEDEMRDEGRSKTPDIRLIVPIAVSGPALSESQVAGGPRSEDDALLNTKKKRYPRRQRVINWIDSKAMFGDPHTHEKENMAQLQGYVHRYGPGMVIYWFDFVDRLNVDPDILLCKDFPSDFVSAASCEAQVAAE